MATGSKAKSNAGKSPDAISELTTARLSVYLRCLTNLEAIGVTTVSSNDLATRFHLNSAQIRKDLSCFGDFGIRGVGYDVARLRQNLIRALGLDQRRAIVIAGAGNLGMALVNYHGFNTGGFRVVAMIDDDPRKIGRKSRNGIPIHPLKQLPRIVARHSVEIGVIAVPAEFAQTIYDGMVAAGIHAVLNFAPVQVDADDQVKVKSVDLRINLESLSYHLHCQETGTDTTPDCN